MVNHSDLDYIKGAQHKQSKIYVTHLAKIKNLNHPLCLKANVDHKLSFIWGWKDCLIWFGWLVNHLENISQKIVLAVLVSGNLHPQLVNSREKVNLNHQASY